MFRAALSEGRLILLTRYGSAPSGPALMVVCGVYTLVYSTAVWIGPNPKMRCPVTYTVPNTLGVWRGASVGDTSSASALAAPKIAQNTSIARRASGFVCSPVAPSTSSIPQPPMGVWNTPSAARSMASTATVGDVWPPAAPAAASAIATAALEPAPRRAGAAGLSVHDGHCEERAHHHDHGERRAHANPPPRTFRAKLRPSGSGALLSSGTRLEWARDRSARATERRTNRAQQTLRCKRSR